METLDEDKKEQIETSLTSFNGIDNENEEEDGIVSQEAPVEAESKIEDLKARQSSAAASAAAAEAAEFVHQASHDEDDGDEPEPAEKPNGTKQNGTHNGTHENGQNGRAEAASVEIDLNGDSAEQTTTTAAAAKAPLPHMKSVEEFSYTSLGAGEDENAGDEAVNGKKTSAQSNGAPETTAAAKPDDSAAQAAPAAVAAAATTNGSADDGLKSLPFDKIIEKVKANRIENKEVCTYVLNLLVGGEFDLEKNFVIQNVKSIMNMIQVIKCAQPQLKAEIWSLFTAILRKSQLNLQACVEIGLFETALHELEDADPVCADLIVEMLTVLANYNVTVDELKAIFHKLKGVDQKWTKNSVKLLNVLKAMPHRYGPDEFFSLPGRKSSGISLPPIRNWPYQNGFTFSTWFRIDPVTGANVEKEKPYLYWFGTGKGAGYTAYFMGSCLVLSYKPKANGKEQQHCIQFEFKPREWYMITITHVYNRWSKSQIHCFVNGFHLTQVAMPFYIDAAEVFDKCYIGCTPDTSNEITLFSGQLSSVYLFDQALEPACIEAMFHLGPSYKNQFRFENESAHLHLRADMRKLLYDGKLTQAIVFLYNPVNCDSQLLLQSAPKQNQTQYFAHNAHALMLNDVRAIRTNSIYSILLSIGGMQVFYLLFNQLDCRQPDGETVDYNVCTVLIQLICDMIEISYNVQIQMINTKGLLAISYALEKASREHINLKVLNSFLKLTKFLVQLPNPNGTILLKQLLDHVLFNPAIWIYCSVDVQTKLYSYLATEFVNDLNIYLNIRRISAVIQTVHALKYYYWVVDPTNRSGYEPKSIEAARPNRNTIIQLRAYMLLYLKELVTKENGVQQDELQALLNYLHTVHENENIIDVLKLVVTLMNEHPPSMIPSFDAKLGIRTVFKLLGSDNETIRLQTLKLLGFFLQKSTLKRKSENMSTYNLFALIADRLQLFSTDFSMPLYNTLYEILVERTVNLVSDQPHTPPDVTHHIENPLIIKVMSTLIRNCSSKSRQTVIIKKQFLNDLIGLCANSRENRRTILQMSVWQEFLIGMAHVYPIDQDEIEITNLVFDIFKILLHHAIKFEYGGWRVWIDTLSILHSRVSKEEYHLKMSKLYEDYEKNKDSAAPVTSVEPPAASEAPAAASSDQETKPRADSRTPLQLPPFRIPEFKWSHMHKRLLGDMLDSIDAEINVWKSGDGSVKSLVEAVNHVDNAVFCVNTIHIISQLADILTNACGGLLPLLASATTGNSSDIELLENTEGMTNQEGMRFLERIMAVGDVVILGCNTGFAELEQEKNLPNGSILRQTLRLSFTYAVRNCLEFKRTGGLGGQMPLGGAGHHARSGSIQLGEILAEVKQLGQKDAVESLLEWHIHAFRSAPDAIVSAAGTQTTATAPVAARVYPDFLLQNRDILRLKALLYRDVIRHEKNKNKPFVVVEDAKQSQYISLTIVYFISVLMVSRYRDIIESNSTAAAAQLNQSTSSVSSTPSLSGKRFDSASINTANDPSIDYTPASAAATASSRPANGSSSRAGADNDSESNQNFDDANTDTDSVQSASNKAAAEVAAEFSEIALSDQQKSAGAEQQQGVTTISNIKMNNNAASSTAPAQSATLPDYPRSAQDADTLLRAANVSITEKLEKALSTVAPFLRDIFIEFSQLLSKIVVGSHGQELLTTGLSALRHSSSVIELVMLLCSQEWQTSLQKHAGLSFIELVNEGRLLSHASKDHIVRVANEADFILNRMRADDVKKHAEFEQQCAQTTMDRKEEELICEHLITAARKRDHYYAIKLRDKILNLITDKQGCWHDGQQLHQIYWKLDSWEDDSRRRRRFVKNPAGSSHAEATLKASSSAALAEDAINNKDELLKQLNNSAAKRFMVDSGAALAGEQQLHMSEAELEQEFAGPIHFTTKTKLICPVCVITGTLSITSNELYFEVDENDESFKSIDPNLLSYADNFHGKWHFNEIRAIFSRRYLLQNIALEIFVANRSSIMFAFADRRTVEKVVNILPRVGVGPRYGLPHARHTSLASPQQLFRSSNMTQKWQRREISNFEYLIYLNTIAGRTYNDLNQYFIFPWVLINYDTPTIDLNSPNSYRDLSKPIGALNPSRRQFFVDRYSNWDGTSGIPPFHYGTHYSTAAFTLNWLIRVEPFTSIFLNLQDGRFDHADRTFHSVSTSWKNCQRDSSDVKELIPEFYYLPEMFLNLNKYNMGKTQENQTVSDVELPRWAKSAHDFVRINRQALESEFVSCQLHQWIDLIFGYKQRGPEAIRHCNVFYYLTYEGAINLESVDDPVTKEALESQIKNFGQTPSQLLTEPHPPRSSAMTISPMMFSQHTDDVCMIMKFLSNAPVIFVCANTVQPNYTSASVAAFQPSIITISSKHEYSINKYNPAAAQISPSQQSAMNNYNAFNESTAGTSQPSTPTQANAPAQAAQAAAAAAAANAPINSQNFQNTINAHQTSMQMQQSLPVLMDQLLAFNTALHKRQLGENFDDKLQINQNNFIVTCDNRFILATGFFDKSFRVFSTDSAKIVQVIYGHYDVVTCINRSEMTQNGNCFIATGSRDSTIMIWIWNGSKGVIVNKDLTSVSAEENPSPGAILTGHVRQIVGVVVSSEVGLVISASQQGPVLVHTVYGDLLRQFEPTVDVLDDPTQIFMLHDAESICVIYKSSHIAFFTINGNQLNHAAVENDTILALAMSQDGQYLIVGGEKGTVQIYRSSDLSLAHTFPACDASIRSLTVTHDQKYIIAGLSTGCLIVFNVNFNVLTYKRKAVTN